MGLHRGRCEMKSLDYWRLCDELTIEQAALLIVGEDPNGRYFHVEGTSIDLQPEGYVQAKSAISSALRSSLIKGNVTPKTRYDAESNASVSIDRSIDASNSSIEVESLRAWLKSRGFSSGFFFPTATDQPDYLNSAHPRYAPKLAAAVNAWLAVTDPSKKTPKQALEKWLRENAAKYGMADEDGHPMVTPIEDCSKVANWNTSGGAPKSS